MSCALYSKAVDFSKSAIASSSMGRHTYAVSHSYTYTLKKQADAKNETESDRD